MKFKYIIVFSTVPDMACAEKIAHVLVEKRFAACCNIIPGLKSVYRWEKKIETDSELLLIIKTKESAFQQLYNEICRLHSYDVPEIIAYPLTHGNPDYLKWIDENVCI